MYHKTIRNLLQKSIGAASIMSLAAMPALAAEVTGTVSTGVQTSAPQGIVISAPTASPSAGTYSSSRSVTLSASGATSIRYTTNGTTPTCSTGTVYSGAISVTSTKTIKAISCYANDIASSVASLTFTINTASSGGGGGGGGGGGFIVPVVPVVTTPVVTTTPTTPTTPTTSTTPASTDTGSTDTGSSDSGSRPLTGIEVLSLLGSTGTLGTTGQLLGAISGSQNDPEYVRYRPLAVADGKEFSVTLTEDQINNITNFITYGDSPASIKLGSGERRAVIRDYLETVGRGNIDWYDVERLVTGQKPINRNLPKEQAFVNRALANWRLMTGISAPDFKNPKHDIAWNTLMYRIRFPRDLVKEQNGIRAFRRSYGRSPSTPFEWAIVRALGYALEQS